MGRRVGKAGHEAVTAADTQLSEGITAAIDHVLQLAEGDASVDVVYRRPVRPPLANMAGNHLLGDVEPTRDLHEIGGELHDAPLSCSGLCLRPLLRIL